MARYYEETALIEFVKQYTPHINGETTMQCVERAIRNAPTADVVPKSEVVKEFTRRFEMYIGNCTFTLGQTNDIQYALKKATEDMIGGK